MWYREAQSVPYDDYRAFMDHVNEVGRGYPSWNAPNDRSEREELRRQHIEQADQQIAQQYGGWPQFYDALNRQYLEMSRRLPEQFPATRQTNRNNAHFILPNGETGPNVFDHSYMNKLVLHELGVNPNLVFTDDQFGPIFGNNVRVLGSGRSDHAGPIQIFYYPTAKQLEALQKHYPNRVYLVGDSNPVRVEGLKAALKVLNEHRRDGLIDSYENSRPESMRSHNSWLWER